MVLFVYRLRPRRPAAFSFTQQVFSLRTVLNRSGPVQLGKPCAAAAARFYSSQRKEQTQKVVVFGIPNPFMWFRTKIYYFLIRTYFDKEFNIEEFTEGAKQVCLRACAVYYHTTVTSYNFIYNFLKGFMTS